MNLWVRADFETYNAETEALVGEQLAGEYADLMGRLATAKATANEALANLYEVEQERASFFEGLISGPGNA